MKKLLLLFLFVPLLSFGQKIKVDTVINFPFGRSYFSYTTKTPLFVVYKLYKGGGNTSRKGFRFRKRTCKSASFIDYSKTGYDIGHLAPSEDFAYNSFLDSMTFFFENAIPQTPSCNRGSWKKIENYERKLSQTDSLEITAGGFGFKRKMGTVLVPDTCFKIIKNLRTGTVDYYLFPNDKTNKIIKVKNRPQIQGLYRVSSHEFATKHNQRERANGGYCGGATESEV